MFILLTYLIKRQVIDIVFNIYLTWLATLMVANHFLCWYSPFTNIELMHIALELTLLTILIALIFISIESLLIYYLPL